MTGYCYDIKNKIVLLCYLSIIFVMAHYYCWLLLATVLVLFLLVILDCQGRLSCVPLVSFMNFFSFFSFFFLIMKIIINVFLYLYLLVIKPFNLLSKYSLFMLWPTLNGVVFRTHCTQKYHLFCSKVESSHCEISGQVCIFKDN